MAEREHSRTPNLRGATLRYGIDVHHLQRADGNRTDDRTGREAGTGGLLLGQGARYGRGTTGSAAWRRSSAARHGTPTSSVPTT